MLTVAIAAESNSYDPKVYLALLHRILGSEVERWSTPMRFSGWRSVGRLAEPFLKAADEDGVRHVLFAIDNDGGARRRPEHADEHDPEEQSNDEEDGCRLCWLKRQVPSWWEQGRRRKAVVVPVQALETWLLCLRGDVLTPTPEQCYDRRTLKRRFFNEKPFPPEGTRTKMALEQIEKVNALEILRQRASFRLLEQQLAAWP